jgi:hypothetical protein
MAKRYASFLVRWWYLDGGGQRVKVEHIQTGEHVLLDSLASAFDWVSAWSRALNAESCSTTDWANQAPGDGDD